MQIVRDLAGYSMGRSDLVRRAMSKKKAKVMEEERHNFVYGNPEQNIPGCIKNGIDEKTANHIYDEMIDFARYAFNKSHAATYAVITMQTAYLKCYYPVEFMAALMTSVIGNAPKLSEYLLHCREQGIGILPPSINSGQGRFTVENGNIRYGMYAIHSVGRNVVDEIVKERGENGPYSSIRDFAERTCQKGLNRRTLENLIKAGALDGLGGTRKQLMQISSQVIEQAVHDAKDSVSGQMSLFDFMAPEEKKAYEVTLPEVGEFSKEQKLSFEKEVLGIYLSGHPLEEYESLWKSQISAVTSDFALDEETGESKLASDQHVTIGGMINETKIKYTKNNKVMAFVTLEDLVGTVEVIVFPKVYEACRDELVEDAKVFMTGRVSTEDDRDSKLILENVCPFDQVPRELWIAFQDYGEYQTKKGELEEILSTSGGHDPVFIFLRDTKQYRRLPKSLAVNASEEMLPSLEEIFGKKNVTVRVRPKSVEKQRTMN